MKYIHEDPMLLYQEVPGVYVPAWRYEFDQLMKLAETIRTTKEPVVVPSLKERCLEYITDHPIYDPLIHDLPIELQEDLDAKYKRHHKLKFQSVLDTLQCLVL
jgi:hypothetical protein